MITIRGIVGFQNAGRKPARCFLRFSMWHWHKVSAFECSEWIKWTRIGTDSEYRMVMYLNLDAVITLDMLRLSHNAAWLGSWRLLARTQTISGATGGQNALPYLDIEVGPREDKDHLYTCRSDRPHQSHGDEMASQGHWSHKHIIAREVVGNARFLQIQYRRSDSFPFKKSEDGTTCWTFTWKVQKVSGD